MNVTEVTTLFVALAALLTSVYSVVEMKRQRESSVRPALVVLEKRLDKGNQSSALGLYLVNMGQAVAINTKVWWSAAPAGAQLTRLQTETFPGRRAVLTQGHMTPCLDKLQLVVSYTDINGRKYCTTYGRSAASEHAFHDGHCDAPKPLEPYRSDPSAAMQDNEPA